MLEATGRICGLHAQVMSSAELTLWARVDGISIGAASQALWQDKSLVKLWAMRGTLHLLPAAEYWTWQAGLSTFDHYLKPSWFKYSGVTHEQLEQVIEAVGEALQGKVLSREELAQAVAARLASPELGEKMRGSWGSLLKPASFHGKLCFGPSTGQKVGFTSPESWLGGRKEVDPEDALVAITRRFLDSNGPASREEYGRWWGVSPAKAMARIKKLGDEAAEVQVEGQRLWMLSAPAGEAAAAGLAGRVNLVPAFDQYVICSTRQVERLTPGDFKARIYRPQGWISPVLLVDGRMDGIWSHNVKGKRLIVMVEPFVPLPGWARADIDAEVDRLARFLECEQAELTYRT